MPRAFLALLLMAALAVGGCSSGNKSLQNDAAAVNAATSVSAFPGSRSAATPPPPLIGQQVATQGNIHVNAGESHVAYNTDPPTSGPHFPMFPRAGVYDAPFVTEYLPHFLEHGGVEVLYNSSTPPELVAALTAVVRQELIRSPDHVLMAPRPEMPCQVTVTAWQRILAFGAAGCQPGSTGRSLATGSPDLALVRQFIERNECVYDPENICGDGVHGDLIFLTPVPGARLVESSRVPTPTPRPGLVPAPPPQTIDAAASYVATIKTAKGDIVVQLDAQAAPITVNNFVSLARKKFYDGLVCHRVVPAFVVQCGDPSGTGSGGPGYTIPDEASPLKHSAGAIAMAKSSAPNSAGSQFYITLAPQPSLDGQYTVFGRVIAGMDVLQKLVPGDKMIAVTIAQQ
jgi:cyclophilin family peptidyl-prolyl cis-trans isomerase